MMSDWVGQSIPLQEGAKISTVCEGVSVDPSEVGAVAKEDTTYCTSDLQNKTYTEHY